MPSRIVSEIATRVDARDNIALQVKFEQGTAMQAQDGKIQQLPVRIARIASIVACATGIMLCIAWIPAPAGNPGAIAAPGLSSGSPQPGDSRSAGNADLAILLDWHMNASNGHGSFLDGVSCTPQSALEASDLIEAGLSNRRSDQQER